MFTQNKLTAVRDALLALNVPCYHYFAPSDHTVPYIVWYEDGEESALQAGNHKAEQALGGYVELFTVTEYDETADDIQTALNAVENLSFTYVSIIYGEPTNENDNIIHHTWHWELM